MNTSGDPTIDFLIHSAKGHLKVVKLILFGSRARGDSLPRSDYDIAVCGPKLTDDEWAVFAGELRDGVPTLCGLDLVRMSPETSQDLLDKIASEGVVLYERK